VASKRKRVRRAAEDSQALWLSIHRELPVRRIALGLATSNAYLSDPKMLAFMASRYKFVAKMLAGRERVFEVGAGDAFGAPLVAQGVSELLCTDIDKRTVADNAKRLAALRNVSFAYHDFRKAPLARKFDAAYCVDVIEHIYPHEEEAFYANVLGSLTEDAVAVIGTPNKTSEQYASAYSKLGHVNTKTQVELVADARRRFRHVFPFGMNDEVLHTGYAPMCHYLWVLCAGPLRGGRPVR
jgi:hypothetical protein